MTELNNEAQLSVNDDATAENTAEAHIEEVFSHSAAKMREKGMSETAMGAAIGLFNGAICVQVDRMRFLPVKTTNDLFIMRSDRFHLTDTYEMEDGNYVFPNVELDPRYYKNIHDFDERFPYTVPSLAAANSVTIQGDWTFGRDVIMFADAKLDDQGEPSYVPNGEYVGPQGIEPDDWV